MLSLPTTSSRVRSSEPDRPLVSGAIDSSWRGDIENKHAFYGVSPRRPHPRSKSGKGALPASELAERHDGKIPQARILQGDEEQPVRYAEVPRKAPDAATWLQQQAPALASADAASDKLN